MALLSNEIIFCVYILATNGAEFTNYVLVYFGVTLGPGS